MQQFFFRFFVYLVFKIAFFLIVLTPGYANSSKKSVDSYGVAYQAYKSFTSNLSFLDTTHKSSNYWDTNVILSNEQLIAIIDRLSDIFFKEDKSARATYLFQSANYYFNHRHLVYTFFDATNEKAIQQYNQEAYKRYLSVIKLEREIFTNFQKIQLPSLQKSTNSDQQSSKIYTNYRSFINASYLNTAFSMHLYAYQQQYVSLKQFSEVYQFHKPFVAQGLDYGEVWQKNMIIYAQATKDWPLIIAVTEKSSLLNAIDKSFYYYAKMRMTTNSADKYSHFKHYIAALQDEHSANYDLAKRYFNLANTVSTTKRNPNAFANFSTNFLFRFETKKKKLQLGIDYYSLAHFKKRDDSKILFNKAMLYVRLQQYVKARYFLEKALTMHTDFKTLYALALVLLQLENYDEAYAYLLEASFYDKTNAMLYNNLAVCVIRRNNLSKLTSSNQVINKALDYIDRAIQIEPNYYLFYKTKANIYKEANNLQAYKALLNKAITTLQAIKQKDYDLMQTSLEVTNVEQVDDFIQKEIQEIHNQLVF